MKILRPVVGFFLILFCVSCKDKVDLNAPYKEIPSIYAVLNPKESKQVIRINKVFLGEGDAYAMAKVADSVNYPAGELTVTLERSDKGKPADVNPAKPGKKIITFTESVVETAPGAFNTNQRVYVTEDSLFTYGTYKLTVKNNHTGNVFTAKANALDSVNTIIYDVPPFCKPYYPVPTGSFAATDKKAYIDYSNYSPSAIPYSLPYKTNDAKIYQVVIRTHFYDSIAGSPNKTYNYLDFNFANQDARNASTTGAVPGSLTASMKGVDFFNTAGITLSRLGLRDPSTIAGRRTYKLSFFIYSSSQEYIDYMQYASASLSISQNKPIYSNFDDKAALGIFTFRTRFSIYKEMHPDFITAFAYNPNTRPYKFFDALMRLP